MNSGTQGRLWQAVRVVPESWSRILGEQWNGGVGSLVTGFTIERLGRVMTVGDRQVTMELFRRVALFSLPLLGPWLCPERKGAGCGELGSVSRAVSNRCACTSIP